MANTFIYQMTDTWANATQDFVAINMNVTDTASTANSALLNLAVAGANQFTVLKSGDVFAAGGLGANTTHTNKIGDGIVIDYNPSIATGRIMVGANDSFIFYSGNSTAVGANTVMMTISNTGVVSMGNTIANVQLGGITTLGTPSVVYGAGSSNSSIDIVITNANTGGNTSSDFAAYDTVGLSSPNFVDMGINGNTWSAAFWTINGPSDGYLYTGNTNLSIGTAGGTGSNGYLNFFTNGTLATNERMRITPGGNVGIANTAPDATFKVTGTANVSGNVVIGGDLKVSGNVVLGDAAADNVTINGNTITISANSNIDAGSIFIDATNNRLGVMNTAPDATLAVTGTANVSGAVRLGSTVTVASNTLTLGTSTATAANGYSYLPNGLKVNWGWVASNTTNGNVAFTSAFGTACLSVMLTSANATANGPYLIQPANTTVAPIRTASATAGNVAYFAIGY